MKNKILSLILIAVAAFFYACDSGLIKYNNMPAEFLVPGKNLEAKLEKVRKEAVDGKTYTVYVEENETIEPQILDYSDKNITIRIMGIGSNRRISLSKNGAMFTIRSIGNPNIGTKGMVTLILENITLEGNQNNNASLVVINNRGILRIGNGANITGNSITGSNSSSNGGGVAVRNGGTLEMSGGTISNNNARSGGGVYSEGVFNMRGGAISGNTASGSNAYGGGVYIENGSFSKTGGTIYGYNDGANSNTVKDDTGKFLYNRGHAVYATRQSGNSIVRFHELIAGSAHNLGFSQGIATGTWESITIAPGETLTEKIAWVLQNAANGKSYTVEVDSNESISPKNFTSSGGNGITVNFIGIGSMQTVSLDSNGSMFTVGSGYTLVLGENITLQGRNNNTAALVRVNTGGTFEMQEGSVITGNENTPTSRSTSGGGVSVQIEGTFNMKGGVIIGNTVNGTYAYGGGVYTEGTFAKTGGVIYGYIDGDSNSNVVKNGAVIPPNRGHAVYAYHSSSTKYKDNIADENMNSNGNTGFSGGAWYNTSSQLIFYWQNEKDEITAPFNNSVNVAPDGSILLKETETLLISAVNNAGYSDQQWFVNGIEDTLQAGLDTYTFNAVGRSNGRYTISLVVKKGDKWYNAKFFVYIGVYTITFNANGGTGTVPQPIEAGFGMNITLPNQGSLARTGFVFAGWSDYNSLTAYNAGDVYTPTGDVTLYARWLAGYTVTFNANSGSGTVPTDMTAASGTSIILPDQGSLTRSGYDFIGWSTSSSSGGTVYKPGDYYYIGNSNTILYASWAYRYTVSFNINSGNGTTPSSITAGQGTKITLPGQGNITRTGDTFIGWNTNSSGTGVNYNPGASYTVPNNNTTLYACWKSNNTTSYTITFNANGGSGTVPSSQQALNHGQIRMPDQGSLTRAGYVFTGWNTNSSGTGNNYNADTNYNTSNFNNYNTTLYARWTQGYTVTFNANGGSGVVPAPITRAGNGSITLPGPGGLTRAGYTFVGWVTTSSGTTQMIPGYSYQVTSSNTTLYARWIYNPPGSELDPIPLTANTWANGEITTSRSELWYSINVSSYTYYFIWWNSSTNLGSTYGDGSKTLNVFVSAYYPNNSSNTYFANTSNGWNNFQRIYPSTSGMVKIKVVPYYSGNTGTFGIVYNSSTSTTSTRPSL